MSLMESKGHEPRWRGLEGKEIGERVEVSGVKSMERRWCEVPTRNASWYFQTAITFFTLRIWRCSAYAWKGLEVGFPMQLESHKSEVPRGRYEETREPSHYREIFRPIGQPGQKLLPKAIYFDPEILVEISGRNKWCFSKPNISTGPHAWDVVPNSIFTCFVDFFPLFSWMSLVILQHSFRP